MFEFRELAVYKKAKNFHKLCRALIKDYALHKTVSDQLYRASFSIPLNIAEGSGRFSNRDRRNFFIIARSSVFECIAILDIIKDEIKLTQDVSQEFINQADEISRILFAMIRNLEK